MDFQTLNRRQLQSLCKLNNIPANITNVAMVDALKSLDIVVGIEEIEIMSPKVPCTSFRTSARKAVKKPETESVLVTASRGSRGVRRQLAGEANEFLKTPSVTGFGKKGTAASTRENTVKKGATVQRVYNTRRSARLTEKRCAEAGVTKREISQPVKIALFSEEVSVISEKSAVSGSSSVETSHESCISSENTEDNVGEGSVENCNEGISKEKVEDFCIEFEKLDVIVDGSDQSTVIERVDCCGESLDLEEKQQPEEKFILNEPLISEEERNQVDNIKPDSYDNLNPCEDGDLEENMMVVDGKVDLHEALSVLVKEHDACFALEEHSSSLLCDKVLPGENSERVDCRGENFDLEEAQKAEDKFSMNEPDAFDEKSDQVDSITPDSGGISYPFEDADSLENVIVVDEKADPYEEVNVLGEEHMAREEHSHICIECEKLNVVIVYGKDQSSVIKTDICCSENMDLEEKHNVEEKFILNEPQAFEERKDQVDNIKPDANDIVNSCEDVDSEENMMLANEKTNPHEALNVSVKEHDVYLASEAYSSGLLCDKILSGENSEYVDCCGENVGLEELQKVEEKFILNEPDHFDEKREQVDNVKPDLKDISNPCDDGDLEENVTVVDEKFVSHEALDVSVEELVAPDSLLSGKVLSGEKVDCCVEDKFILNELETYEEIKNQLDNIIPLSEGILNPCEDKGPKEKLVMVNEQIEPHEAVNVSVKEHNVYLASEEHTDSLLFDEVLTEVDNSNADSISGDTENPIAHSASISEIDGSEFHEALNVSVEEYLDHVEHSDNLLYDTLLPEADGVDADAISCDFEKLSDLLVSVTDMKNEVVECNGCTNDNENPSELLNLDIPDNHNVAMEVTAEPGWMEENISTNHVDDALVNPNEQEPSKDLETPEETENSLIKETALDIHQETEEKIRHVDSVIDHPTLLTPIKNKTSNNNSPTSMKETSQVSDNENIPRKVQEVIVEDDQMFNKKAEDEKPLISLNDMSIRQLKKQLKALSIKSNMKTNKDDQVDEARPVLQAVCDNHLATGEET